MLEIFLLYLIGVEEMIVFLYFLLFLLFFVIGGNCMGGVE